MNIKRIALSLLGSLLIFFYCLGFSAFAETSLPDGAVKGLPERLAALDDEGNPVNSATGEYFFHVEGMKFGETYSKNIQLMNLREDASYHIYFYTEPLFKAGEIDLEEGCECRFYLDGREFYRGDVNGNGSIDLRDHHFDCGYYAPGQSHTLRCEIVWNDLDVLKNVDNGWRLYDRDGEHVLRGPNGEGYVEGEIEFKWVFYAMIENSTLIPDPPGTDGPAPGSGTDTPDGGTDSTPQTDSGTDNSPGDSTPDDGFFPPYTGFMMKDGKFWLISMGVIALMIAVLLVLIKKQKKDKKK